MISDRGHQEERAPRPCLLGSILLLCLLSLQEQTGFLCLPEGVGGCCVWVFLCTQVLPYPTGVEAWAGLYISGVADLNPKLLFLEDYTCRGWEERPGGLDRGWEKKVRGLNIATVGPKWS